MASEYRPAERRGASEARGSRRGTHGAEEAARFAAVRHFISPRFVRAPEGSGAARRKNRGARIWRAALRRFQEMLRNCEIIVKEKRSPCRANASLAGGGGAWPAMSRRVMMAGNVEPALLRAFCRSRKFVQRLHFPILLQALLC